MLPGSSARFTCRIRSSASPSSASRNGILPCPMPCSPVQVPSIASARSFEARDKGLCLGHVGVVLVVEQQADMEVAVTRVPDDRGDQPVRDNVLMRRLDAIGKPRDRHADIGGQDRQHPARRLFCAQ